MSREGAGFSPRQEAVRPPLHRDTACTTGTPVGRCVRQEVVHYQQVSGENGLLQGRFMKRPYTRKPHSLRRGRCTIGTPYGRPHRPGMRQFIHGKISANSYCRSAARGLHALQERTNPVGRADPCPPARCSTITTRLMQKRTAGQSLHRCAVPLPLTREALVRAFTGSLRRRRTALSPHQSPSVTASPPGGSAAALRRRPSSITPSPKGRPKPPRFLHLGGFHFYHAIIIKTQNFRPQTRELPFHPG